MGGSASAKNGMQSLNLKKGESIVLIAGEEIELQLEPGCLLFRASAPA